MSRQVSGLRDLPTRKAIRLRNVNCPYCGLDLVDGRWDEDHAIARRFVPRGTLDNRWNLILRTCKTCNRHKGDLENDLSAITMQPSPTGEHATLAPRLREEARRKGKGSVHRGTGRSVAQSQETAGYTIPLPGGTTASMTLVAPPRLDAARVFELARLQINALFFLVTYREVTRRGGFLLGDFYALSCSLRGDWGSSLNRTFMSGVRNWETRVLAIGADDYFKAAIRRHPSIPCWSWALEWNQNLRVIGFAGDLEPARAIMGAMPASELVPLRRNGDGSIEYLRPETSLLREDDVLFVG